MSRKQKKCYTPRKTPKITIKNRRKARINEKRIKETTKKLAKIVKKNTGHVPDEIEIVVRKGDHTADQTTTYKHCKPTKVKISIGEDWLKKKHWEGSTRMSFGHEIFESAYMLKDMKKEAKKPPSKRKKLKHWREYHIKAMADKNEKALFKTVPKKHMKKRVNLFDQKVWSMDSPLGTADRPRSWRRK